MVLIERKSLIPRNTHLSDNGKNPRLPSVITICSNSEIDLLRVRVGFEGSGELEDTVFGRERNFCPCFYKIRDRLVQCFDSTASGDLPKDMFLEVLLLGL